ARMSGPQGIALDAAGSYYIADLVTQRIRKVDASTGIITTVAGSSPIEILRGLTPLGTGAFSGDGGAATAAQLWSAQHVAVDTAGNLYIPCTRNNRVRKVDTRTGIITTVAGSGPIGLG